MQIEDYLNKAKYEFELNGFFHFKSLLNKNLLNEALKDSLYLQRKEKIISSKYLHIHKKVPSVMKIFRNDMLKFVLKNTLNYNKIFGLQSEFFFNPPGTTGYGQHQDDFFLKTGKNNSANLWIPLIKTSKKNGTVFFSAKSHKLSIKNKINNENLNNLKNSSNALNKFDKIYCKCNVGDAILISNYIFHGSGENKSNYSRYVLALGYINNKKKYYPGQTANRKPFII